MEKDISICLHHIGKTSKQRHCSQSPVEGAERGTETLVQPPILRVEFVLQSMSIRSSAVFPHMTTGCGSYRKLGSACVLSVPRSTCTRLLTDYETGVCTTSMFDVTSIRAYSQEPRTVELSVSCQKEAHRYKICKSQQWGSTICLIILCQWFAP